MQEHEEAISEVGFVPHFQEIDVDYDPGTTINVEMHDGSHLRLRKLHEDFNPTGPHRGNHSADVRTRKRRSSDRYLLRRHAKAQLHRDVEPRG